MNVDFYFLLSLIFVAVVSIDDQPTHLQLCDTAGQVIIYTHYSSKCRYIQPADIDCWVYVCVCRRKEFEMKSDH